MLADFEPPKARESPIVSVRKLYAFEKSWSKMRNKWIIFLDNFVKEFWCLFSCSHTSFCLLREILLEAKTNSNSFGICRVYFLNKSTKNYNNINGVLSFNPLQSAFKHTLTKRSSIYVFSSGFRCEKSMVSHTTGKSLYGTYFLPILVPIMASCNTESIIVLSYKRFYNESKPVIANSFPIWWKYYLHGILGIFEICGACWVSFKRFYT